MNNLVFFQQYRPYYNKNTWYETLPVYEHLRALFEDANRKLIRQDIDLFNRDSCETAICGALMLHLKSRLWGTPFNRYNVDIEYNRNHNDPKRVYVNEEEATIICDLIVHSRGRYIAQDNLISVEMKKEYRSAEEKQQDKYRLMALTRPSFDDNWIFDGTELPRYVCRYILGVYYEIRNHIIYLEYYRHGVLMDIQECLW